MRRPGRLWKIPDTMTHDSFLVSFFRGGSDIFGGVYIHDLEGQKGTPS